MDIYERIFEFSPEALLVSDGSGRIVQANEQTARLFGYDKGELIGRSIDALVPGRLSSRHTGHRERYLAAAHRPTIWTSARMTGRRKDDSEFPVDILIGPLTNGDATLVLCAVRDCTARARADEEQRVRDERMQAIFDAGLTGMAIVSPQRTFLEVNGTLATMLGVTRAGMAGRRWRDFEPPADGDDYDRLIDRVAAGDLDRYRMQKRLLGADGRTLMVEIAGRAVRNDDGSLRYLVSHVEDIGERHRAAEALRASEERYRTLVEQATDGIFTSDPSGRYLDVNAAGAAMLGYTRDEIVSMTVADIVATEDCARVVPELVRLRLGLPVSSGWRFRRKDGSTFFGEVNARQLPDGRLLALLRDVTDRVHAEEALRRSEASLNEAQNLAKIGSWELDLVDNVLTWSDEVYRLFETTRDEFAATYEHFLQFVHPDDRARVDRVYSESVRNGTGYEIEHRLRMADGRIKHVHERGRTVYDEHERPARTVGTVQDVTQRRLEEQQHTENEAMLAAVINSVSDAIIGTDVQGRVMLFNPAAERIFKRSAAVMLGQRVDVLLPPRTREHHGGDMAAFAASQVAARNMSVGRVQGVRADGTLLELESSISQFSVNGRKMLTALMRDITERVHSERAMAKYRLELGELARQLMEQEKVTTNRLAQALHDQLGQTLTAMRIDFVSEAQFDDPAQAARHARVDRLIDAAVRDVRQALAELRPTLLVEMGLVEALHNELRTRQPACEGVRLLLDAPTAMRGQRWPADVEHAAFMIAREAVSNAVQHGHPTLVRVTLAGDAHALHLEIVDNGCGVVPGALTPRPGHLGVVGMRERSIAIGARFEVRSLPVGGTSVRLTWEERR